MEGRWQLSLWTWVTTIRPSNRAQAGRKLKTREELEQAYKRGSAVKARVGMRLFRIEGDDGEVWGYFFAPLNVLPSRCGR